MIITPLSYEEIKKINKIEFFANPKATVYGGLPIFISFLRKVKIKNKLEDVLGEAGARAILQIMLGVFAGARTMEKVAEISKDKSINAYLGSVVSETQITRILKKVMPSNIQALHDFSLSLALLDIAGRARKGIFQTLDIDATPKEKYGHQEGVEVGYIGDDNLAKCYQYLFIRNDYMNTLLYGTIRGGAANSQNNFCGYLNMILPLFAGLWSLRIRADSGFFNEAAFSICTANRVWFYVKAPMSKTRSAQAKSPYLVWEKEMDGTKEEYANLETVTKDRSIWREVFKRVPSDTEEGGYRYDCIATNDMDMNAWEVYNFYNGRARIENINDEMKNDYALGAIVTKSFQVNDIITQATIILHQLVRHFARNCLDKVHQSMRLSTLRETFFLIPAVIVSHARQTWLRLSVRNVPALTFCRIAARIASLWTVFCLPAMSNTS